MGREQKKFRLMDQILFPLEIAFDKELTSRKQAEEGVNLKLRSALLVSEDLVKGCARPAGSLGSK